MCVCVCVFEVLGCMNKAVLTMLVQILRGPKCFWGEVEYLGLAGLHSWYVVKFIRNCQTVFQSGCSI